MFSLTESHRFFLCQHYVDMRNGIDNLCSVVRSDMGMHRSRVTSSCFSLPPPFCEGPALGRRRLPRDRDGSFDPQTVRKRETILAEGMADQIIGMYAFGTSTREISKYFEREFNTKLSAETISAITDRVLPEIKEWKSRSLDPVYAICWLDAVHYKVKDDSGRAVTRAVYNVLGVNKEGHKELLGMYVARSEGANFWLEVLTDLQNRIVEDT